jgi:hypothetical protein
VSNTTLLVLVNNAKTQPVSESVRGTSVAVDSLITATPCSKISGGTCPYIRGVVQGDECVLNDKTMKHEDLSCEIQTDLRHSLFQDYGPLWTLPRKGSVSIWLHDKPNMKLDTLPRAFLLDLYVARVVSVHSSSTDTLVPVINSTLQSYPQRVTFTGQQGDQFAISLKRHPSTSPHSISNSMETSSSPLTFSMFIDLPMICSTADDCHGHGICSIETKTCQCADGWAGDMCDVETSSEQPSRHWLRSSAGIIMQTGMLSIVVVVMMVLLRRIVRKE